VILALLAVVLSPYILVAAAAGLLVSGVQLLPDPLKAILPAPVREVEVGLHSLPGSVRLLTCNHTGCHPTGCHKLNRVLTAK
jgi:hypothetical protein